MQMAKELLLTASPTLKNRTFRDIDILTGWNIFGFDLGYTYKHVAMVGYRIDFYQLNKPHETECHLVMHKVAPKYSIIDPEPNMRKQETGTMELGKNQHVVKSAYGWAVKSAGNSKATKLHPTQQKTIEHAEQIARNQKSDTKTHERDGKIRAGNSHGNDPHPLQVKNNEQEQTNDHKLN